MGWTARDGYKQYLSDAHPASYRVRRVQLDVNHSYTCGVAVLRDWDSYIAFDGPLFSGGGKHHTPSSVSPLHLSVLPILLLTPILQ